MSCVEAIQPTAKTLYEFVPTQDFYSKEFESTYITGMSYHVREGNAMLNNLVRSWEDIGMVTIQEPNR